MIKEKEKISIRQLRNLTIACLSGLFIFSGCKEEPPGVNYKPITVTYDTTYVSAVIPAAQVKEVLLEDITGTSCYNCPKAAQIAKDLVTANPGRLNVVALYNTISGSLGDPINKPPVLSAFDFRNILATGICQLVAIPGVLPNGYIDRNKFSGNQDELVGRDGWIQAVIDELKETTPVNISLNSTYDNQTKELTTDLTITYTGLVSGKNYISVSILEDSIVDAQEALDQNNNVVFIQDYVHRHVMRDMYTAAVGDLLNTSDQITLIPGRVIKKRYIKKIEKLVPYSSLKVVAFVHGDPSNKYVLQSKEADVE